MGDAGTIKFRALINRAPASTISPFVEYIQVNTPGGVSKVGAEYEHTATAAPGWQWREQGRDAVERWVEEAQSGDAQAFDRLMAAHQDQVFRVALRLLGNREDALDVTQDVFLRLYRYLNRYDRRRPLRAWLYTMTVNAARDCSRRHRRNANGRGPHGVATAVAPVAREHLSIGDERAVIEAALRQLSEKERAAVVLHDIEGLSTEDTAKALGSSATTVRSQLSRARVKLRKFRDETAKGEKHVHD